MTLIVEKALTLWGMNDAEWSLVAARENHVYRVQTDTRNFALRLHRQGMHSDAALRSELLWIAELGTNGVGVPTPVPATDGSYLHLLDGVQVDMLDWLPGRPLGSTGTGIDHDDRTGIFRTLGREMAKLHEVSDAWTRPDEFARWSWDRAGLLGDAPLWGRFWENPTLSDEDRALLTAFRKAANSHLQEIENQLDYGLIHADLVRENVMVQGDKLWLIDFDDAGFGFRLFDIATTLLKNLREPDYGALQVALLEGYRIERVLDTEHLDLFMALRAVTYVGWISSRMDEDGSQVRNTRFIETARELLKHYLG
ncbi:phosphotransferase enzyme family protein [Ruegeria arenilitoris]|uniref:phosphotransferase enzyme family protein n=1 Tax=Ruegeria arenilitoris TaxID=1173585 RepID=UPI0014809028|nr:phosphotransferase [Ruegeria arenilitoris]